LVEQEETMRRLVGPWALAGWLAVAGPATAQAAPDRAAVLDVLNQLDRAPTRAEVLALGAGVEEVLIALSTDPAVPPSRAGRAVSALAFVPTAEVLGHLQSVLSSGDALLRRKAGLALIEAQGAQALPLIAPHLADADPLLREALVRGLARLPEAAPLLRARLAVESSPLVLEALTLALGAEGGH
jgi:HEAT repeat protein